MALHSSSLLDRKLEEEELVSMQTRPSRGPTPQSRLALGWKNNSLKCLGLRKQLLDSRLRPLGP